MTSAARLPGAATRWWPAGRELVPARSVGWRTQLLALVPAAVLSIVFWLVDPASQDFASGDFRARLFRGGVYWWNLHWFAGHPLPGYGLIPPALGAWFGVSTVSVISLLVATWAVAMILHGWSPPLRAPHLATWAFAASMGTTLWGGRLTFGPSVAFGALCLLAYARRRTAWAVLAALGAGLSSPVGALFLAITAAALWWSGLGSRRRAAAVGLAALLPPGLVALAFPEEGWYPFTAAGLTLLVAALIVLVLPGRAWRTLVAWTLIYLVAALGAFVVRSALGGNIVRLAWLACAPLAVACWPVMRRTLLPLYVAAVLVWGWSYVQLGLKSRAASSQPRYFEPLAAWVAAQPDGIGRVEVVPVHSYRHADELALRVHLARGWVRQLDRERNAVLYTRFTPSEYLGWLHDNAVRWVAVPHSQIEPLSRHEAAVATGSPEILTEVWSNQDWQVYEVRDAVPLIDGGATVRELHGNRVVIDAPTPGRKLLRLRSTRWLQVTSGAACLAAEGPWTVVDVARPGTIVVEVSWSWAALRGEQLGKAC